jgi:hypothetical protein
MLLLVVLFTGCGGGGGDGENNSYPHLVSNVSQQNMLRYPDIVPPNYYEEITLDQSDYQYLYPRVNALTSRHDMAISKDRLAIGMHSNVPIYVDDDFRITGNSMRGGATGHTHIRLDGKYLDILYTASVILYLEPYAATIGFPLAGDAFVNDSFTRIVSIHNGTYGYAGNYIPTGFTRASLTADAALQADAIYYQLVAAVVYHEFGHYYYAEMLNQLRAQGTIFSYFFDFTPKVEDNADFFAGMMMAKAGYSMENLNIAYKLMTYYSINQNHPFSEYDSVVGSSSAFYWMSNSSKYSSLSQRINIALQGYQTYKAYR